MVCPGAVLFASHVGHEVSLRWDGARALQVGERFRLRKAAPSAIGPFETVADADGLTRLHVETDPSRPLQYFELRVANRCEELSLDKFPAER